MENCLQKSVEKWLAPTSITVVGLIAQGYWVLYRGVHAENYWILRNLDLGFFQGFLYSDPNRPFMALPFHLSYVFFGTSYTAIQFLHLIYGVTIGILTYFVARKFELSTLLSFCAGLIAVTHGGDFSSALFSMIVVRQIVILLLLLILLEPIEKYSFRISRTSRTSLKSKNSNFNQIKYRNFFGFLLSFVALYTYESIFPILIILVIMPYLHRIEVNKGIVWANSIWILHTVYRYLLENQNSYQSAKFRLPNPFQIYESSKLYLKYGFQMNSWDDIYINSIFKNCVSNLQNILNTPFYTAIFYLVAILSILFIAEKRRKEIDSSSFHAGKALKKIGVILVLISCSYLPYLFVIDGASNWRTQFLAMPWIGILIALVVEILTNIKFKFPLIGFFASVFSGLIILSFLIFGIKSSLMQQLEYSARWDNHKEFFRSIVDQAPKVEYATEFLILDVPTNYGLQGLCRSDSTDPFEDTYWLQAGFNSYYKNDFVVANYLKTNINLRRAFKVTNSSLRVESNNLEFKQSKLVILEYLENRRVEVLGAEDFYKKTGVKLTGYNPDKLLQNGTKEKNAKLNLRSDYIPRP